MAAVLSRLQMIPDNAIATLYRGAFGKVEFLRCNGLQRSRAGRELSRELHFTLPLAGSFVWHAEHDNVFADPTTLLCTQAGESFLMSHPHGGDQSIVLSPSQHALSHLTERAAAAGLELRRRTLIAPAHAQLLAHAFYVEPMTNDAFATDERMLEFFESAALGAPMQRSSSGRRVRDHALVQKALDYVHYTPEPLLTLQSIAAALQVRAAYLTRIFAERTGQPLYRYIMSLKLARALHRIATTDQDLTNIALDLGFSSHSHLSAAFKLRYGMSPSQFRQCRRHATPRPAAQGTNAHGQEGHRASFRWRPLCAARGGSVANEL